MVFGIPPDTKNGRDTEREKALVAYLVLFAASVGVIPIYGNIQGINQDVFLDVVAEKVDDNSNENSKGNEANEFVFAKKQSENESGDQYPDTRASGTCHSLFEPNLCRPLLFCFHLITSPDYRAGLW